MEKAQRCLEIPESHKSFIDWMREKPIDETEGNLTFHEIVRTGLLPFYARLQFMKSDFPAAIKYYEAMRIYAEKVGVYSDLVVAYTGLGLAWECLGEFPNAAKCFRQAIEHVEAERESLRRTGSEREKFFDVKIAGFARTVPYKGLARVLITMNQSEEAIRQSEYTKARVFAEVISEGRQSGRVQFPKEVVEQDSRLHEELADLTQQLQLTRAKGGIEEKEQSVAAVEQQMKETKARLATHVRALRDKYPLFAAVKYPEPMDLGQAALKDSEWVLAYDVTDSGIIIYLTKGRSLVKGLFKPIPIKEVDELVRKFRKPMELGPDDSLPKKLAAFDFKSGKKLSDILLSDILPDLPKNTAVIIVPDGSLGVVPFEMLVLNEGGKIVTNGNRPQTSGAEFFGDRNPISYYQSITALTLARTLGKQQKPGQKLLAMVDPVFSSDDPRLVKLAKQEKDKLLSTLPKDLTMSIETESGLTFPRLPLTAELGESLKKSAPSKTDLYEGMQAIKSVLLGKDLTPYRSLVFATHGYFGKDLPGIQEPVLVLSLVGEPRGQDGFLRMTEVMGLKMNCDVAALTACQTGLGRHVSGEGTMGMGRAFQVRRREKCVDEPLERFRESFGQSCGKLLQTSERRKEQTRSPETCER